MKKCNTCKIYKDYSLFSCRSESPDGLAYKCKSCVKEYMKEYRKENKDKIKEYKKEYNKENKEYKKENRDKYNASEAKRRAVKLNATPPWLTKQHLKRISAIYTECTKQTKESGIEHHVDHQIPLQGKDVCGLHVPWNLEILTAIENKSKGNR